MPTLDEIIKNKPVNKCLWATMDDRCKYDAGHEGLHSFEEKDALISDPVHIQFKAMTKILVAIEDHNAHIHTLKAMALSLKEKMGNDSWKEYAKLHDVSALGEE